MIWSLKLSTSTKSLLKSSKWSKIQMDMFNHSGKPPKLSHIPTQIVYHLKILGPGTEKKTEKPLSLSPLPTTSTAVIGFPVQSVPSGQTYIYVWAGLSVCANRFLLCRMKVLWENAFFHRVAVRKFRSAPLLRAPWDLRISVCSYFYGGAGLVHDSVETVLCTRKRWRNRLIYIKADSTHCVLLWEDYAYESIMEMWNVQFAFWERLNARSFLFLHYLLARCKGEKKLVEKWAISAIRYAHYFYCNTRLDWNNINSREYW